MFRITHPILAFLIVAVAPLSTPDNAHAQSSFTYQGHLEQDGTSVQSPVQLTFRVYGVPSGGVILDTQTFGAVPVVGGRFTVDLNCDPAVFNGGERWLSIEVNGVLLAGRQKVNPAPYAAFALNAPFKNTASSMYYIGNTIGIGTSQASTNYLLYARSATKRGIVAIADAVSDAVGLEGIAAAPSGDGIGVFGSSSGSTGIGVYAVDTHSTGTGYGLYAQVVSPNGYAGYFQGGRNYFSGAVGIGTASPSFALHVNGTAGKPGGGSWSVASDVRLKTNVEPLHGALDQLMALRGVTFEYCDPASVNELPGRQIGMIAQDVEKIFPQWIDIAADGYKRLTFRGFEALTVEAMRELRTENATLRADLAKSQHRTDELERRLAAIEAQITRLP